MTSNAFLARLGNCARQQHQNVPAGMSMNEAFWRTGFGDHAGKIGIFLRVRAVPPAKPFRIPKGYAVSLFRNPGLWKAFTKFKSDSTT